MFQGNPYDNIMLEAVHELQQSLKVVPPSKLNVLRWLSTLLRQRRAVLRLSLPERNYPKTLLVEEECA
jgi:hypothetical protein